MLALFAPSISAIFCRQRPRSRTYIERHHKHPAWAFRRLRLAFLLINTMADLELSMLFTSKADEDAFVKGGDLAKVGRESSVLRHAVDVWLS